MSGSFRICAETNIVVCEESLMDIASNFARFLAPATGYALPVRAADEPGIGNINLQIDTDIVGAEAYELKVSSEQITISAATESGAFYGIQTLRQLLPVEVEAEALVTDVDWAVDGVRISDSPQYDYRGMHLDVSRHFFSLSFVKRFLDWMALHKFNTFHWHLVDDQGWRIEIKKYPRLTDVGAWRDETVVGHTLGRDSSTDGTPHGGYYTQDDIREIVRYAGERCITVIPEIDMPGHSSALLASYPMYGCRDGDFEVATHFGIFEDVLCPSAATFDMINGILTEVAELFPGPYIHIGGDEAITTQWQQSGKCQAIMRAQGLTNLQELHRYFVDELDRIVAGLGKKAVGWDDILEGDQNHRMTIVAWRGTEHVDKAARQGHDVVISPSAFYFDSYQSTTADEPLAIHGLNTLRDIYEFELVPNALEAKHRKNILGAQGALWTEYVATESAAEYMSLPRMCAVAEQVWSHESRRSWSDFAKRLRSHYGRFDVMGVNASRSVYNVTASASILTDKSLHVVLQSDGDNHAVRYTLDGTAPTSDSPRYLEPLVLSDSATIRASAEDNLSGNLYGDTRLSFVQHKALGCAVKFAHEPEDGWGGDPAKLIVNGLTARDGFFLHRDWAGFFDCDMDAVIDLGDTMIISEVTVGFATLRHRSLFPPTGFAVSVSMDGDTWRSVVALEDLNISREQRELSANFASTRARYVRVICNNDTLSFSHETQDMKAVSIYVDEIVVL